MRPFEIANLYIKFIKEVLENENSHLLLHFKNKSWITKDAIEKNSGQDWGLAIFLGTLVAKKARKLLNTDQTTEEIIKEFYSNQKEIEEQNYYPIHKLEYHTLKQSPLYFVFLHLIIYYNKKKFKIVNNRILGSKSFYFLKLNPSIFLQPLYEFHCQFQIDNELNAILNNSNFPLFCSSLFHITNNIEERSKCYEYERGIKGKRTRNHIEEYITHFANRAINNNPDNSFVEKVYRKEIISNFTYLDNPLLDTIDSPIFDELDKLYADLDHFASKIQHNDLDLLFGQYYYFYDHILLLDNVDWYTIILNYCQQKLFEVLSPKDFLNLYFFDDTEKELLIDFMKSFYEKPFDSTSISDYITELSSIKDNKYELLHLLTRFIFIYKKSSWDHPNIKKDIVFIYVLLKHPLFKNEEISKILTSKLAKGYYHKEPKKTRTLIRNMTNILDTISTYPHEYEHLFKWWLKCYKILNNVFNPEDSATILMSIDGPYTKSIVNDRLKTRFLDYSALEDDLNGDTYFYCSLLLALAYKEKYLSESDIEVIKKGIRFPKTIDEIDSVLKLNKLDYLKYINNGIHS